jgi:carbamoylphosphate synthase small subunit
MCAKGIHTIEEEEVLEEPSQDEAVEREGVSEMEENLEEQLVTLCSFTNSGSTRTLKYKGMMGNTPICVLVDTGVTHSFINSVLVKDLQLKTVPIPAKCKIISLNLL